MDKAKLLEQFSQLLNEIELKEQTTNSFYDFESFCVQNLTKMNNAIVEEAIGKETENFRKKKQFKGIMGT